jgi:hypothetical protein
MKRAAEIAVPRQNEVLPQTVLGETAMAPKRLALLLTGIRQYLTPSVWKQAHQTHHHRRSGKKPANKRWDLQPLVLTLLTMTWCCGDSQSERFETAKAFCIVARSKRRRPGQTVQGFQKALADLPFGVLRSLAAGVRRRLLMLLDWVTEGFVVFGCDGSSLQCPRTVELERRLDAPPHLRCTPQVWITALVHLRTGVPWAWRFGKGHNRERHHLRALLPTLPERSLIVADAGYDGYDLGQAIVARGASFLIRMSSKNAIYTEKPVNPAILETTNVLVWPNKVREAGKLPLKGRLLHFRAAKKKHDVWLLTNVLDERKLTRAMAQTYYRWRWENEGFFRTYKRTLAKVKLTSRTIHLVHREAEGAMLATQLLLAIGAEAIRPRPTTTASEPNPAEPNDQPPRCSPRQILREVRRLLYGLRSTPGSLRQKLTNARRENRPRTSSKVKRPWPGRRDHRPPKSPTFLTLPTRYNYLWEQFKTRTD